MGSAMGGASPYRAQFIGLTPSGQPSRDSKGGLLVGDKGEKYFGLVNASNTCYVNSVLQALYFCSPFRQSAIRHLSDEKEEEDSDSLVTSLAELFAQIDGQKRPGGCIMPRRFLSRLRKANEIFCSTEQQDAHEFMQFLLNDIAENLKARVQKIRDRDKQQRREQSSSSCDGEDEQPEEEPRTWIHDIFRGYLVNQMKCLCCENITARREAFLDLSVDIEQHTSIAACLRAFESTELLRSDNKFFCDMCGCLQEAEKRLRIYQLPSVLMLHLKRFKYLERLGRSCRLPYRVVFPQQLRVVEHRQNRGRRQHAPAGTAGDSRSAESSSPRPDAEEEPAAADQPPSRLFELRSVVVHIGRHSNKGHYVTLVRSGDRWVLLDDDIVRVVEPEVLRSFYGTAGSSANGNLPSGGGDPEEHQQSHAHSSSAGWSSQEAANDGSDHGHRTNSADSYPASSINSPSMPLYERLPEGTCCGYLLLYEAVGGGTDHDAGSELDMSAAVDWISEERHITDSDSDQSNEADSTPHHLSGVENLELMQDFEQRCIPRNRQQFAESPGRQQYAESSPARSAASASIMNT